MNPYIAKMVRDDLKESRPVNMNYLPAHYTVMTNPRTNSRLSLEAGYIAATSYLITAHKTSF